MGGVSMTDEAKATLKVIVSEERADPATQAILNALAQAEARLDARHDETDTLVRRSIDDQVGIRAELAELRTRLEAIEARTSAHDGRMSGFERKVIDVRADTAKMVSEVRAEVDGTLVGFEAHVRNVQGTCEGIREDFTELKDNVEGAVLGALEKHALKIEEAADRLTNAPRVRTAAAVGGAALGGGIVGAIIEVVKHL